MKLIMYPAISLDGFIADMDGDCYSWIDDEDEAEYVAAMARCGCDIVGRNTYEQYKDEYDAKRNIVTFVCTNGTKYKNTTNLKFINGSATEIIKSIEKHGFKEAILSGGGEINGLFASAGLVDEIFISIYSLILGAGIPLFGSYKPRLDLQLLSSNNDIEGIVKSHYKA